MKHKIIGLALALTMSVFLVWLICKNPLPEPDRSQHWGQIQWSKP